MNTRLLAVLTLVAFTGLLSWTGCGSDETGGESADDRGSLIGTAVLEGVDDFSGIRITAGEESQTTDEEGSYEFARLSPGELVLDIVST